ncbi:hypothetical protein ZOSMA_69G00820 [Zostera marina]|uniref:DCD domain-containing protein n=1 Tax=Zostera marina TaxID=29655 RepID=A0A0K9NRH5_ZOSMR|nr:hypothetical protein ZOSMA_69G00820 [Zostera marina]
MTRGIRGKGKKQKRNDAHASTSAAALGIQNKKRIRNRRRNPQAQSTPAANKNAGPSSDPVTATNNGQVKEKSKERISGFIFMCNAVTKPECYQYCAFGLPKRKLDVVERINRGTKLFLYDFDLKLLYGVYKAIAKGGENLEPKAFRGKFPAQVKFEIFKDCLPLPESDFKHAIKDNYNKRNKFDPELSSGQVRKLISLFRPFAVQPPQHQSTEERRHLPPHHYPDVRQRSPLLHYPEPRRLSPLPHYPDVRQLSPLPNFPDVRQRSPPHHYLNERRTSPPSLHYLEERRRSPPLPYPDERRPSPPRHLGEERRPSPVRHLPEDPYMPLGRHAGAHQHPYDLYAPPPYIHRESYPPQPQSSHELYGLPYPTPRVPINSYYPTEDPYYKSMPPRYYNESVPPERSAPESSYKRLGDYSRAANSYSREAARMDPIRQSDFHVSSQYSFHGGPPSY